MITSIKRLGSIVLLMFLLISTLSCSKEDITDSRIEGEWVQTVNGWLEETCYDNVSNIYVFNGSSPNTVTNYYFYNDNSDKKITFRDGTLHMNGYTLEGCDNIISCKCEIIDGYLYLMGVSLGKLKWISKDKFQLDDNGDVDVWEKVKKTVK